MSAARAGWRLQPPRLGVAASMAGYPVASPFGSASSALSTQVTALLSQIGDPKDAARSVRVSRLRISRLASELPDRDHQVLGRIAEHGYLATHQVQRFVFTDHASDDTATRTTRRVLTRLQSEGLVASLTRRQGGPLGGSAPRTWLLTPGGARLVGGSDVVYRKRTPSVRWLLHCLAVAESHLALRDHAARTATDLSVQVEPHAWRTFAGVAGDRRMLKPDLWASLQGHDELGAYRDEWFVEVDLGTESLATLVRKCGVYADYYRSGAWQTETTPGNDGVMPLVLWIFDNPTRISRLRSAVKRSTALPNDLFRFATLHEQLTAQITGGTS